MSRLTRCWWFSAGGSADRVSAVAVHHRRCRHRPGLREAGPAHQHGRGPGIRDNVLLALDEARLHGSATARSTSQRWRSQRASARHIPGSNTVRNVVAAIRYLASMAKDGPCRPSPARRRSSGRATSTRRRTSGTTAASWASCGGRASAGQDQLGGHRPLPGQRVGRPHQRRRHLVRRDEQDPQSARLPSRAARHQLPRQGARGAASAIKVHQRVNGRTVEKTLPQRLAELGCAVGAATRT